LNQVSGTNLPNLIFDLLDENDIVIDKTYLTSISDPVILTVTADTSLADFIISSDTTTFYFSGSFNISSLAVTGIPGTTVLLKFTSSSIKTNSLVDYEFEV
jgi:hypothetical protein